MAEALAYGLSVDLGTTYTAAATLTLDSAARPEAVGLGNRALQIPSVLFLGPDGEVLVGEAAERRAAADPSRVAREFKRRIGDPVPMVVAGSPYSAQSLTARLLRAVVAQVVEARGGSPAWVVLTHPANWGPFKLDLLRQAAALADLPDVRLCPEPVGAALQFAATRPVGVGERIAVFDLGGGTFDACVLIRTAGGFEILGRPDGVEHLGGADFDEAVFRHVLGAAAVDLSGVDVRDPALTRLRRDCVDAKEALSADPETFVVLSPAGTAQQVRLTRSEFEEMIRPAVREALDATRRTLRSAQVEPADLRTVVLIGGSSRIPLVAEMVVAAFGRPVARTGNPKHDVVLGALWTGPGVALPPAPDPAGPSSEVEDADPSDGTPPVGVRRDDDDAGAAARPGRRPLLLALGAAFAVVLVVGAVVWWPRTDGGGGTSPLGGTTSTAPTTPAASTPAVTTTSDPAPDPSSDAAATDPTGTAGGPAGPTDPGIPQAPTPLPEATVIAALDVDGVQGLYPVDTVTGAIGVRLPTASVEKATVSPDRRSMVYLRAFDGGTELRVIGTDGSGDRPLFAIRHPECQRYYTPAWSPTDPDLVAAACAVTRPNAEKPNQAAQDVFSMLVFSVSDGSVVTRIPVDFDWYDGLSFSADGTRLAFFGWAWNDTHLSLYDVAADGSERSPTRLTDDHEDFDPVYSPETGSSAIAFRRLTDPGDGRPVYDIDVLDTGSAAPRRVPTDSDDNEIDPSWSPDGSRLVYRSSRGLADDQLYRYWIADADGGGARLLTDLPALAPAAWGRR
ncbi:Hsp70 family protein [Nakamurella deserti]|uniref:Hsp70 family protein n=1 Tax=Nakamurella deserti TaxID=2164074 RepID=UPI0014789099|nr:Hsp70 family protein [Nakamurella deserti]